jgi:TetR/AcrR family transcriptional repressor of nem operon
MPWQKNYDETKVLESAMISFWSKGYEATSMNDLVKATGINRGSLYAAYPSKRALFMSALRHYDRIYRVEHLQRLGVEHGPLEAIFTAFEDAAAKPSDAATPGGCLLVNTALEMSPHDPEIRDFVDSSLRHVEAFFCSRLDAARREGTIATSLNARTTAQELLGLFLGLRVLTRARTSSSTIKAITSRARMMLV